MFGSTGAEEVRRALDASGEPPVAQMRPWYESQGGENLPTSSFWELCEARDQYRREYANYWRQVRLRRSRARIAPFKTPADTLTFAHRWIAKRLLAEG